MALSIPDHKEIYSTHGDNVLSTSNRTCMETLMPCNHEEADTRLMIHASDASIKRHRRIKIRSNDTDVVVLAVGMATSLPIQQCWVTYGAGKNVRDIPVPLVAPSLGPSKAPTLPMFHALTGCDTVSFFRGRGKKTAWDVWSVFPELTPVLQTLKSSPECITEECMAVLERFVVLLYDRTSNLTKVNEGRQELFCKKSRDLECIPPTNAALEQHVRRAVFQGGHVWVNTFSHHKFCRVHLNGDGSGEVSIGHLTGRPWHRPKTHAMNLSSVAARPPAEEGASVSKLI